MALENTVTEDNEVSQGTAASRKRRRVQSVNSVPGMHVLLIVNGSSSI